MEHTLVAILAADVVGYSRHMATDEERTHARLKALRQELIEPRIAHHHGRVVKLTGDGAMVLFMSVVKAVECAAAIQRDLAKTQSQVPEDQRIQLRIGINLGDIIIEQDDVIGDDVNIAARLEKLAEPGGICIARDVYNRIRSKLALPCEPMGDQFVKNIPEPVFAYRVLWDPLAAERARLEPSNLEPAEAARQEWLTRAAASASYLADLSRQADVLATLLGVLRGMLATNEAITDPLWRVASAAAALLGADDEGETIAADLRAGALSPKDARRRLAAVDRRRTEAKHRVRVALDQLRAHMTASHGARLEPPAS
jgi:class 3 adenylate cyclase